MNQRSPIDFSPGEAVPAVRVLELMNPHRQAEVLCEVIRRGDEDLIHWALIAAPECREFVHAAVLREAAGSDNRAVAIEAVRSQAVLETEKLRIQVLGQALASKHEPVGLEALKRLRQFDILEDSYLQIDVADALCYGVDLSNHEPVGLQILDLATEPGLHNTWNEFRIVCKAQDRGTSLVRHIARARVIEMQKKNPDLNELDYRR